MADNALLAALLQSPDDESLRLVYADWLEDQGETERSEFIRVECELEHEVRHSERWRDLTERQLQLIRRFKQLWTGEVKPLVSSCRFRRGFVELVTVSPEQFLNNAAELYQLEPVLHVNFNRVYGDDAVAQIAKVADSKHLSRLTHLSFDNEAGLQTLLASPHLASLHTLNLHYYFGSSGFETLARWPGLRRIRHLDLGSNNLADADFAPVVASGTLAQLETLVLNSTEISDSTLIAIASGMRLKHLGTSPSGISAGQLTDRGLQALARSSAAETLLELNLEGQRISDAGIRALAESRARLRHLNLGKAPRRYWSETPEGVQVTDAGVEALASGPAFAELHSLGLQNNALTDRGALALAASPHLKKLGSLNLKGNRISKEVQKKLRNRFGVGVCTFSRPA